jgi:photosystem II stability/assembly factor-like uncharacterized protein
MKKYLQFLMLFGLVLIYSSVSAEQHKKADPSLMNSRTFSGLKLRAIGPALMSGRISDIAIDPNNRNIWYVAVGSGGVWKTVNAGITFSPIFDGQTSYSIGCVTIDPDDSLVVWVGSGENVSGRHVGYGDGVYKSLDGGKTWANMGLKMSEHIDRILIDPRDTDTVYVAAEGPLWSSGGQRGVFKSTDGGKTWKQALKISPNTGVTDLVMDPENSDILYAAAHQRRRHVAALVNGGPESAIYKTVDSGKTWKKITKGLPKETLGQIALAISPQKPDVIYASVETAIRKVGFYRSDNGGGSWIKMSQYTSVSTGPHYYQELFCCPHRFDRLYAMDNRLLVSDDGGKNWGRIPELYKHGDNHALAFDSDDPEYLLCGSDGGIYETFDRGKTWRYISNLPVTQFYRIGLDNDLPFYNIVGGTQDNCTQLGPSRTLSVHGIRNSDWVITLGGDGYACQIDPRDPNTVYCEWQVGNLARYDKRSGETIDIKPRTEPGEPAQRWNWDSPILISPHSHSRLYFGSQRLYRSDNRGDSWTPVSPDLSRGLERLQMKYMGRSWSVDAVWDMDAMSYYGNITTISESPVREGLIYCGTDDGLIQVTEDGGKNWRKINRFPGVPEMTFVNDIQASMLDENVVFAVFDNHKRGDFTPYILKSVNRGRTWASIRGNIPDRDILWSIEQDHLNRDLLFIGSEFGIYFTVNGGKKWIKLTGEAPTISFRDLEIQRRESDLVAASFGRGIFILDDYSPLRMISEDFLKKDASLFPVKKTPMYFPIETMGGRKKASQGDTFYTASNPPHGAVFTYYLKNDLLSRKKKRLKKEADELKSGKDTAFPGWETIKAEDREDTPVVFLEIKDDQGQVVRRLAAPATKGFHRVAWDLCYPSMRPPRLQSRQPLAWEYSYESQSGFPAGPGSYTVRLLQRVQGQEKPLGKPQAFECYSLNLSSVPEKDQKRAVEFKKKSAELQRISISYSRALGESLKQITHLKKALDQTANETATLYSKALKLEVQFLDLQEILYGDQTRWERSEPVRPGITGRLGSIIYGFWRSNSAPTLTMKRQMEIVEVSLKTFGTTLNRLIKTELEHLFQEAEKAGVPWTQGRINTAIN